MKTLTFILNTITSLCGALLILYVNTINQRLDRIEGLLDTMKTHSYRIELLERRLESYPRQTATTPLFLQISPFIKEDSFDEMV